MSVMSIRTQRDIVFGHARIGYNKGQGPMQVVALKLDAYLPAVPGRAPTPALVLAHGGVFHRGSKESDIFSSDTGTTTAIAEYCRRFAMLGFPSSPRPYALSKRATWIMASILSVSCSVASRRAGGASLMPLTASVSASLESFPCPVR